MKGLKGYGFFIIVIAVILIAIFSNEFFPGMNQETYTFNAFKEDIENKKIASVTVKQNQEIPTGQIVALTSDSEKKSFYTPNVNNVVTYLETANFTNVSVLDVEKTPWYLEVLPYVFGFILIFFLFTMMTGPAQGGGGGSNSKMMNFGKSRAKMTSPDDKVKTFADVAGLVEEKEQLDALIGAYVNGEVTIDKETLDTLLENANLSGGQ